MCTPDTNAIRFPVPTTTQIAKYIDSLALKRYLSPQVSSSAHFFSLKDNQRPDLDQHQIQYKYSVTQGRPIIKNMETFKS